MYMREDFVAIAMVNKKGRKMYLKASDKPSKNVVCEWSFDYNEAIWFNTDSEAEKFAKQYFKSFANWCLEDVWVVI